jgi:hypothetical protein
MIPVLPVLKNIASIFHPQSRNNTDSQQFKKNIVSIFPPNLKIDLRLISVSYLFIIEIGIKLVKKLYMNIKSVIKWLFHCYAYLLI